MNKMMTKPKKTHMGLVFDPIPAFSDAEIVFGAPGSAFFPRNNLPHVPVKYTSLANSLFFNGGEVPELRSDINHDMAMRYLRSMLSSWSPSHEQKEATVGYALWCWMEEAEA